MVLDFINKATKITLADNDPAFTETVHKVFPYSTRLMFSANVMRNTNEKLAEIRSLDTAISQRLSNNRSALQRSAIDDESFHVLYVLLRRSS